jgi:hypothetical protein
MNFFNSIRPIIILSTSLLLTSCYRMPSDDEYSLVPVTNNPSITFEKSSAMPGMPGASY